MVNNQFRLAFERSFVQWRAIKTQFFKDIKVRCLSSKTVKYDIYSEARGRIFRPYFWQGWKITNVGVSMK